jgi:colanic acid biosynthesis protein WcaH
MPAPLCPVEGPSSNGVILLISLGSFSFVFDTLKTMSHWISDLLYREIIDKVPVCTVDLALFNQDATQVLVFRRSAEPLKGEWFTLGGRLRKNETVKACALRQAESEAGLNLDSTRLFFGGVFDEIHDSSRFGGTVTYHCVDVCWGYVLGEDVGVRLDRQHNQYEWRPVADPEFVPMLATKLTAIQLRAREWLRSESLLRSTGPSPAQQPPQAGAPQSRL